MPMDRSKYPGDWEAISKRIRFGRAGGTCEARTTSGERCDAPHGRRICRWPADPEQWAFEYDALELSPYHWLDPITVVLTVAHLNHDTTDNREENLMAMCQLHHLRLDLPLHKQHAAATRRRKLGMAELFGGDP
jgi:hypothetical protein